MAWRLGGKGVTSPAESGSGPPWVSDMGGTVGVGEGRERDGVG